MKTLLIALIAVVAGTFMVLAAPVCACQDCGTCCPCECQAGCC